MFELKPQEIEDGSGTVKQGFLMECPCGGDIFHVFILNGLSCLHYQCAQCESSICGANQCQSVVPGAQSETAQRLYSR